MNPDGDTQLAALGPRRFFFASGHGAWFTPGVCQFDIVATTPVLLEMDDTTEEAVIRRLIRALAGRGEVRNLPELERAVLARQKLLPPLLGNGVALPHARTPAVTEILLVIGRCREPVPFGPEQVPVRLVFLYGVPTRCIAGYLAEVAGLTRLLKSPGVLQALLTAPDEATFRTALGASG